MHWQKERADQTIENDSLFSPISDRLNSVGQVLFLGCPRLDCERLSNRDHMVAATD